MIAPLSMLPEDVAAPFPWPNALVALVGAGTVGMILGSHGPAWLAVLNAIGMTMNAAFVASRVR